MRVFTIGPRIRRPSDAEFTGRSSAETECLPITVVSSLDETGAANAQEAGPTEPICAGRFAEEAAAVLNADMMYTYPAISNPYGGIGPGVGQTEVEPVDGIVQCRFVPARGRLGAIQETASCVDALSRVLAVSL